MLSKMLFLLSRKNIKNDYSKYKDSNIFDIYFNHTTSSLKKYNQNPLNNSLEVKELISIFMSLEMCMINKKVNTDKSFDKIS